MSEKTTAARALIERVGYGTLATHSVRHAGWPFASMLTYAVDHQGRPIFLISGLAVHTKNLQQDARASLLVIDHDDDHPPLERARVTVMGEVREIPGEEHEAVHALYRARYPDAQWIEFGDFRPYRMEIADIYYVGGFGAMGWVSASEYAHLDPPL